MKKSLISLSASAIIFTTSSFAFDIQELKQLEVCKTVTYECVRTEFDIQNIKKSDFDSMKSLVYLDSPTNYSSFDQRRLREIVSSEVDSIKKFKPILGSNHLVTLVAQQDKNSIYLVEGSYADSKLMIKDANLSAISLFNNEQQFGFKDLDTKTFDVKSNCSIAINDQPSKQMACEDMQRYFSHLSYVNFSKIDTFKDDIVTNKLTINKADKVEKKVAMKKTDEPLPYKQLKENVDDGSLNLRDKASYTSNVILKVTPKDKIYVINDGFYENNTNFGYVRVESETGTSTKGYISLHKDYYK
ncbi:MAG: hypothetical protein U9N59_16810 [Campylobacterota bacterium]|nr:hypothetical protein [Campylobacterota bacterium]